MIMLSRLGLAFETAPALPRFAWMAPVLAAILVAIAAAQITPNHPPLATGFAPLSWAPATSDRFPLNSAVAWTAGQPPPALAGAAWVRTRFRLSEEHARRSSSALILSGVFSARVFLNGAPIGAKGQPSAAADGEVAGPIDAVIPLGGAGRAGENELLLYISLQAAHHRPGVIIQDVSIAAFGAEPRRPLTRYVVALSQAGVLIIVGFALAFTALTKRQPFVGWAAIGAFCLFFALAAETARAWWSYPYDLHVVRLTAVWVGVSAFGAAIYAAVCSRVGVPVWKYVVLVFALSVASVWFGDGVDHRTLASFTAFAAGAMWIGWRRAATGDSLEQTLVSLLAGALVFAWLQPAQFLDNGVYVIGSLTLSAFLWADGVRNATPQPETISVAARTDSPGREIVFVKAEGNYAEIRTAGGAKSFLRQTLSDFPISDSLMRVHRSYIVNLTHVRRLVANTGSRYHLELANGACVPVSRKLVTLVRDRLRAYSIST